MSNDERTVAVVTGASRGIGRATAELLRCKGIHAVGVSRSCQDTDFTRRCDIRDGKQVDGIFHKLFSTFGRVDILVNCAAVVSKGGPLEVEADEWENVLRTNLIGTYMCCKYAIQYMRKRGYGRIVNVASIAGRSYSRTASIAYTSSKYGVVGLTRHLAAVFGREGININCVAPSQTLTETLIGNVAKEELEALASSNPLGRLATPEEVAKAICFLISEGASYINGAVIDVNGGQL